MQILRNFFPVRLPGWIGLALGLLLVVGLIGVSAYAQGAAMRKTPAPAATDKPPTAAESPTAYLEDPIAANKQSKKGEMGAMLRGATPLKPTSF